MTNILNTNSTCRCTDGTFIVSLHVFGKSIKYIIALTSTCTNVNEMLPYLHYTTMAVTSVSGIYTIHTKSSVRLCQHATSLGMIIWY